MEKPYNRIILIGNGFDRALGLLTGYEEFAFHILKGFIIENIDKYNNHPLFNITWNSCPPLNPSELSHLKTISNIKEIFAFLKHYCKIDYTMPFIRELYEEFTLSKWVDVERFYYDKLNARVQAFKNHSVPRKTSLDGVISLNVAMDKLSSVLEEYISRENSKSIFEPTKKPFIDFIYQLGSPLNPEIAMNVKMHQRREPPEQIAFVNFNYTNTITRLVGATLVARKATHFQIHGEVGNKENPIIFGYGDDTGELYNELVNYNEPELLKRIKSFYYPDTYNYRNLINFIDTAEFDVYIVGHSCGLSDRTLLKQIFNHEKCIAIQNFHYRGRDEDFLKRIEVSRHFNNPISWREKYLNFNKSFTIPQSKS